MNPDSTPEQEFANMMLNMTPEQFDAWAEKMSIEEIAKATIIISQANQQLQEAMECLQEEAECEIEEQLENDSLIEYFPEAQDILSKYTLNGLK